MTENIVVSELLTGAKTGEGTVVIVDIFRATSMAATLFELGAAGIYPAIDPVRARALKRQLEEGATGRIYICGESRGITPDDFDFSNSPYSVYTEFSDNLEDKTIVSTTSNGMRGVLSAEKATEVITASFLNYKAVVEYLERTSPQTITVVGMGEFGRSSDEDKLFSYFLRDTLKGQPSDISGIIGQIYECKTVGMMRKFFGNEINNDIDFCLDTKREFNVVPQLYEGRLRDVLK